MALSRPSTGFGGDGRYLKGDRMTATAAKVTRISLGLKLPSGEQAFDGSKCIVASGPCLV